MMKSFFSVATALCLALGSTCLAADDECYEVVPLGACAQNHPLDLFGQGGSDAEIMLPEGFVLPVSFFLSGDILELHSGTDADIYLEFKQTLFIRRTDNGLAFSLDGEEWLSASAFFCGQLSAQVNSTEEGAHFFLGGVLKHRGL